MNSGVYLQNAANDTPLFPCTCHTFKSEALLNISDKPSRIPGASLDHPMHLIFLPSAGLWVPLPYLH
jgi:hypothetical protein